MILRPQKCEMSGQVIDWQLAEDYATYLYIKLEQTAVEQFLFGVINNIFFCLSLPFFLKNYNNVSYFFHSRT